MNQANLMQSTFITATVLRIRDAGVCVMDVGDEQTITTDAPPQDVPAPASVPESQDDGGALKEFSKLFAPAILRQGCKRFLHKTKFFVIALRINLYFQDI